MPKDVTLHVYQLAPSQGGSFMSRFLPGLGMGAYHTSLEIDGYRYTFAANAGIIKTLSRNEGLPEGANFQESVTLGTTDCSAEQLKDVLDRMATKFHNTAYHLVHRNCNHFSETFATACCLYNELPDCKDTKQLSTYPSFVNRLANTGRSVVGHDEDIVPTDVFQEASYAVRAQDRIGWDLESSKSSAPSKSKSPQQKKQLTEKQKALLQKLRKK